MIYIDADACPVREEIYRVATRTGTEVIVVRSVSSPIRPPGQPGVRMVIVPNEPDAADDWIAAHITPDDICVTGDIPLAKRCLDQGARALDHKGQAWTGDNIGTALAGRAVAQHMREIGLGGTAHAPLARADRSRFLSALDAAVTAARRGPPGTRGPGPGRP